MIDTPIFQLRIELLMRNFEKVSQLFGVIEPEHVSDRSHHAHLEGDRIVFAKLVMKDRKKPEKFWLPHGMPSDDRAFAFSSRVFPKASQIKALYKLWHYQKLQETDALCDQRKNSGPRQGIPRRQTLAYGWESARDKRRVVPWRAPARRPPSPRSR